MRGCLLVNAGLSDPRFCNNIPEQYTGRGPQGLQGESNGLNGKFKKKKIKKKIGAQFFILCVCVCVFVAKLYD